MKANITSRPKTIDEVIIKKGQVVSGTVNVPVGSNGLAFGTIVTSKDGGKTWDSLTTPIYTAGSFDADDEVFHNGKTWKSLAADNVAEPGTDETKWQELESFDANGVLLENITETLKVAVLVTGEVREKFLLGFDASMNVSLFKNKIILR